MSFLCPVCGTKCEDHYTFCSGCGSKTEYETKCDNCGNPATLTQNYCVSCGKPVFTKEKEKKATQKWKLFPMSIILYFTLLFVHLIFFLIFRKAAVKNMPFISIFDSLMILIWASFPVYNIKETLKLKYNFKWWHIFFFIGGIIVGFFVALGIVKSLQIWLELPNQSMVSKLMQAGHSFTAIILMVCVQPAIIEEIAFRGIVYKSLNKAMGAKETILISAFLFAMLHLSIISLPHLMLLGVFFGYLRYKTGSIWPGVIAHFVHNFSAVMVDKYGLF